MLKGKPVQVIYDKPDNRAGLRKTEIPASGKISLELNAEGGALIIYQH